MERIVKGIWFPIDIWEADDLSWNEKILLMEIDSFTSQGKDCFISDEYIAEALKISVRSAATMVSNLIHKGYVKKTRFDGRKRYLESTLAEQLCKNCRADMQDLQTTYIESTYISPTEIINKGNRFDFKKALMEIGVTEQVAEDWLKVRKEAKASNTETAFKGILREIEKTGLSADECIRVAAENSWRGFKAEWLFKQRKGSTGKPSVLENNIAVVEELMRMSQM
jgi:DNA-binding MarR family transcriptional regulator